MEALPRRKLAAGVPAASAPPCAPGRGHRRLHCRSAPSPSCRAASGGARSGRPGGAAGGNGRSMQSGKAGHDAARGRATGAAAREERTVALCALSLPLATRKALLRFPVLVWVNGRMDASKDGFWRGGCPLVLVKKSPNGPSTSHMDPNGLSLSQKGPIG